MSIGSIKGGVLTSRLAFLEGRGGPAAVDRVLATLPAEDRTVLSGNIAPSGWYPFETGSRLDTAIEAELGGGDALFREMGAQSARDNLSPAQRAFVRERDPHALLKGAASIYRLYYDTGRRTFERLGQRKVALRTYDSTTFSRADCLTVIGWHEQVISMCGGNNVRVTEVRCRTRGDEVCEYICEWD
jgi:uncharacterized protein (TIGR02265 family)